MRGCWQGAASLLLSVACGGGAQAQAPFEGLPGGLAGFEDSRCHYEGRKDRVAVLTQGRGSSRANIRRVYAVGTEKDGRRILRCREADTNLDGHKDIIRTYNERGEPQSEQADTDYDGRLDTWIQFAAGKVFRAEVDHNDDGKPDEFKVYSAGKLARIQRDTTFNGQIDTWEVYELGQLRRIGRDTDGDQRVDFWYRDETKQTKSAVEAQSSGEAENEATESAAERDSTAAEANETGSEQPPSKAASTGQSRTP